MSIPASTAPGRYSPVVFEANGVTVQCVDCLTVVPGPKITSVARAPLTPGQTTSVTVTGSGFSADAKLTGPNGVTFSAPTVSSDGTTITATATVAATASAGANLPLTVKDGPLGSYGSAANKALTIA